MNFPWQQFTERFKNLVGQGISSGKVAAVLSREAGCRISAATARKKAGLLGLRFRTQENDQEKADLIAKLWNDGLSLSCIAHEVSRVLGQRVSRNSVSGVVHRMGLPAHRKKKAPAHDRPKEPSGSRKPPVRLNAPGAMFGTEKPVVPGLPKARKEDQAIPVGQRCSLFDLDFALGKCRWPVGDPSAPDFFFCGGKTDKSGWEGCPYCGYHKRIAYKGIPGRAAA